MKVKVFQVNAGGSASSVSSNVEKEINGLLSGHPDLEIEHVDTIQSGSGLHLILVFYKETKKEVK